MLNPMQTLKVERNYRRFQMRLRKAHPENRHMYDTTIMVCNLIIRHLIKQIKSETAVM